MQYALTEEAANDITAILEYSIEHFGMEKAGQYYAGLKQTLALLATNPSMAYAADDLVAGYFRFPYRSHMIYFRLRASSLLIVRVLHKRMDVITRLLK